MYIDICGLQQNTILLASTGTLDDYSWMINPIHI